jgi:SAM-dependent methyltransferase
VPAHEIDPLALERPPCPLCGAERREPLYANLTDLVCGLPGRFGLVRCARCRLVYLCPRPAVSQLAAYYPDDYGLWVEGGAGGQPQTRSYRLLSMVARGLYRLRFGDEAITLPPFGRGRMLDVGCGTGDFLAAMATLGWDTHGVEIRARAVQVARARLGAERIWHGTLETLDESLVELDLITMLHVLEHVPNPGALLAQARRRLAPSGRLKVIVPDGSGLEARLFGRFWLGLDVPRHLAVFTPPTLRRALDQAGLVIESCRPQYLPDSGYRSLRLLLEQRHGPSTGPGRRLVLRLGLAAVMCSYPFGNRGAIEVVARPGSP